MDSASLGTTLTFSSFPPVSSSCVMRFSKYNKFNVLCVSLMRNKKNGKNFVFKSLRCYGHYNLCGGLLSPLKSSLFDWTLGCGSPSSSVACLAATEAPVGASEVAKGRLHDVVMEFRSLSEPIDRVKRLLQYAAVLPLLDESARVPVNRVPGCTVQVWLVARMDEFGRMRFGADSDSEITKGFCSCLISMLDGAWPEEVLEVKTEDLADLNVGLSGRAHSRVNTWLNVLIGMQKKTKALAAERDEKPPLELRQGSCSLVDSRFIREYIWAELGPHPCRPELPKKQSRPVPDKPSSPAHSCSYLSIVPLSSSPYCRISCN